MRIEPVSSSVGTTQSPATSPLEASSSSSSYQAKGLRLALLLLGIELGQLLTALDQTVVGTAAPRILADLNGFSEYAWVATAYLLASTVTMPIYGKLSDMYGRRWFFMGGMLVFLAGSALAGASHTMTQLIIFRALQGVGGGAIMPIVSSIIGDVFPPAERGKWQGVTISVWGSPRSSVPQLAAGSPTTGAGAGSFTSTCPSASWRWKSPPSPSRVSSRASGTR